MDQYLAFLRRSCQCSAEQMPHKDRVNHQVSSEAPFYTGHCASARFLKPNHPYILDWTVLRCGVQSAICRMCGSIPDLYSLDVLP